jgi:hypothetical protein
MENLDLGAKLVSGIFERIYLMNGMKNTMGTKDSVLPALFRFLMLIW